MTEPTPKDRIAVQPRRPSAGCHVAVLPDAVMLVTADGNNIVLTPEAIMELAKALPDAAYMAMVSGVKPNQDKTL